MNKKVLIREKIIEFRIFEVNFEERKFILLQFASLIIELYKNLGQLGK